MWKKLKKWTRAELIDLINKYGDNDDPKYATNQAMSAKNMKKQTSVMFGLCL